MAQDSIISANLTLFAGQFVGEADIARRNQLKTLLIEEEDKIGRRTEKLEQVLHRMGECSARIANLETLLDRSRSNGYEVGPTEQVLRNMRELHRVYDDYRQSIVDGLNRASL
jgi:hypothetical protein